MAQKFIGFDDAAEQLGISKDRLQQLREQGKLRAYRDGASWKFRTDEIESLASEGVPSVSAEESSIGLPDEGQSDFKLSGLDELADETPPDGTGKPQDPSLSQLAMEALDPKADSGAAASDVNLDEPEEPTVPVDVLESEAQESDEADASESILLSEAEFGDSPDRPPSTIIGKVDFDQESDLDIVLEEEQGKGDSSDSDVKLAPSGSGVLSSGTGSGAGKSQFDDIAELEIDLEEQSSRILSPEVAQQAKAAAAEKAKKEESKATSAGSDLELAATESGTGLSGLSELALDTGKNESESGLTGISSLELEEDEGEDVLGDGSDITLSSGDSGINIVAPSDSGLGLDDVPLNLGGSAIGSSLELSEAAEEDISLEPIGPGSDAGGDEDFLLTPVGEETAADEESSSQVIALDDVAEPEEAQALLGTEDESDLSEHFAAGLAPSGATVAAAESTEAGFSMWNVMGLAGCALLLSICGMMMVDLVRNIWSWNDAYSLNSSLIDSILSLF